MVFTAPAKVNLYLRVIRRRDDGYHDIETVFERISLYDRLTIEPSGGNPGTIECSDPSIPTGSDSLLGRTLGLFSERSGKSVPVRVVLEKNIPVGAGLGGGSSDAATLLKALNEITGSPLSGDELIEIGKQLGADVPFFLNDCSFGLGKGRGDEVESLKNAPEFWHVLVTPPFEVLSKDVYGKVPRFGLTKGAGIDRMMTAFSSPKGDINISGDLRNDLQAIVLRDFPVLERVLSELRKEGAKGALVSGSGPTVFGIFDRQLAGLARDRLQKVFPAEENWRVCVAQTY